MASTNKTANYALSQFTSTDKPAWIADYNQDMFNIDAGMKANADADATINASIESLSSKVDAVSASSQTNATNIANNTNDISTLQTTVSEHSSSIEDTKGEVATNSSDITTLKTGVQNNANSIATLQTSVGKNATSIANITPTTIDPLTIFEDVSASNIDATCELIGDVLFIDARVALNASEKTLKFSSNFLSQYDLGEFQAPAVGCGPSLAPDKVGRVIKYANTDTINITLSSADTWAIFFGFVKCKKKS